MRQLFNLLVDSFVIWSRNFTLVYIFLFGLLLFESLMSLGGFPELTWQWGLFALVMLLLFAAIMAGWFNMVAQACVRFLEPPRPEALKRNYVKDAFKLLGEFLPGVSQFFGPTAVVYGLHLSVLLVFGWLTQDLWNQNFGLLSQTALLPIDQRTEFLENLTLPERAALVQMTMTIIVGASVYSVFSMLLMLWPAFVVFYRKNGLQACLSSAAQFFRDPLKLFAIVAFILMIRVPLVLVSTFAQAFSPVLGMLLQFMNLLAEVFFTIILFVYAYQVIGKPIPEPQESETSAPAENPPNQ